MQSICFILLALIRMIVAMKMFQIKLKGQKVIYSCLVALILSLVIYYTINNIFVIVGCLILMIVLVLFLFRKNIKTAIKSMRE